MINRTFFLVLSITITTVGASFAQPSKLKWSEFSSYDGRFRLKTPGEMKEVVDSIETAIGLLAYHTFFHESAEVPSTENLVYMVSYCDYPAQSMHSDSLELLDEFFEATIDAAVNSVRGELRYSDAISLKDYPGRIWRIDYLEGGAVIKTKAFFVGRRYYAIQTITTRSKSLNTDTDKFFDSFALLE